MSRIVLGSGSPRRRDLLAQVGIECVVRAPEIDESVAPSEAPTAYVERMAREKCEAALAMGAAPDEVILTGDTSVVVGESILGKPRDDAHAFEMLAMLRGRGHAVLSAVAVGDTARGVIDARVVSTSVRFRPVDDATLRRYIATGEGRDKAGAYAIQGVGGGLVAGIEGSYPNVVGLPIAAALELLMAAGALEVWP